MSTTSTAFKFQVLSYPQALGELTKKYWTIAVSGTHGKSTTTTMIGLILKRAGLDPTVFVGTKVKEFKNSNCRVGKSKYLVIEADEWQASFLNYWPQIIVLTNIEREHLDYYRDLNHILKTYKEYISHLPKNGILIINQDDKNIAKIINQKLENINPFSLKQREAKKIKKILKVPGEHNIYNALAALTTARALKIPDKITFKTLSEYRGAWRRFEEYNLKMAGRKVKIISDYAHHPTEIKSTLQAVRQRFGQRKIWAIFQPHQYQRTFYLFDQFSSAFDQADEIILTKIYDVAGREETAISKKTSAKKLAKEIKKRGKKVHYIDNFERIPQFLKPKLKLGDIILIMGAGDIYKLVEKFSTTSTLTKTKRRKRIK